MDRVSSCNIYAVQQDTQSVLMSEFIQHLYQLDMFRTSPVRNVSSSTRITYLLTPWSRVLFEKLTVFAANQEIPRILWNPKVHYRTHKRPPKSVA